MAIVNDQHLQTALERVKSEIQKKKDIQTLTATATGLSAGSSPTVQVEDNGDGEYNIAFGIPSGADGAPGEKGDKGDKGDPGDPAPVADVADAVKAWMDENIDDASTIVIDSALKVEGAAADAAATGALGDVIINVSETQPTAERNKLWIKESAEEEYTVPTYEEFETVKSAITASVFTLATKFSENYHYNINASGDIINVASSNDYQVYYAKVTANTLYEITTHDTSGQLVCAFFDEPPKTTSVPYNGRIVQSSLSIVAPIDGYIAFRSTFSDTNEGITYLTAVDRVARSEIDSLQTKTDVLTKKETGSKYLEQGAYTTSQGASSADAKEMRSNNYIQNYVKTISMSDADTSGLKTMLLAYSNGAYIGTWRPSENAFIAQTFNADMLMDNINMDAFRHSYPLYDFMICVRTEAYDTSVPVEVYSSVVLFEIYTSERNEYLISDLNHQITWDNSHIKNIAHRGSNIAPENTMAGFQYAVKSGFEYIETDVAYTSDGVAVLLHDTSINRTARNADGSTLGDTPIYIYDITYEQALAYDFGIWKGEQYAGEKIPTLAQFLDFCRKTGVKPYIELKYNEHYPYASITRIPDEFAKYGLNDRATIISFTHGYIDEIANHYNGMRIGVLSGMIDSDTINYIVGLMQSGNKMFADVSSISSELIESCISENIPVEMWFSSTTETAILSADTYISGFTTDDIVPAKLLYDDAMGN